MPTPRVDIYTSNGPGKETFVGSARLVDGKVELDEPLKGFEHQLTVPGSLRAVTTAAGRSWLRAFWSSFRTPYVIARWIDDDQEPIAKAVIESKSPADLVVSDGSDPIAVASAVSGIHPDVMEKYRGMTADQIKARIAEKEAERIANEVRP